MDDKKFNELDKLLRDRLLDDRPADNQWNVPPDSLFDKVAEALPEPRRKRRGLFFIIPALFGIALISFFIFYTNQKIDRLHTEINDLKNTKTDYANIESQTSDDELKPHNTQSKTSNAKNIETTFGAANESDELTETVSAQPSDHLQQSSVINAIPKSHRTRKSTKNKKSKSTAFQLENKSIETTPSQNQNVNANVKDGRASTILSTEINDVDLPTRNGAAINSTIDNQSVAIVKNSDNSVSPEQKFAAVPSLNLLDIQLLNYSEDTEMVSDVPKLAVEEMDGKKPSKVALYAFAGINSSALKMKNEKTTNYSLTGYDQFHTGYQFGLGSTIDIHSKLALVGELAYTSYRNISQYNADFYYDASDEVYNLDGTTDYVTTLVVESPMHKMQENATFRVDNQNILNDDVLNNDSRIEYNFKIVELSLGAQYEIASWNRLSLQAGLGVRNQFVTRVAEKMDMNIYHQGKTMLSQTSKTKTMSDVNRYMISGYVTLGLSYKMNDRISLLLNSGYDHGFSSLRVHEGSNSPSIYLRSIKVQAGVRYNF